MSGQYKYHDRLIKDTNGPMKDEDWSSHEHPEKMLKYLDKCNLLDNNKMDCLERWHKLYPSAPPMLRASVVREVFGMPSCINKFQWPLCLDPNQQRTVQSLARAAYSCVGPDLYLDTFRLFLISDALEESGFADEDVLMHLRGRERVYGPIKPLKAHLEGVKNTQEAILLLKNDWYWRPLRVGHIQGCWVLDLILRGDSAK